MSLVLNLNRELVPWAGKRNLLMLPVTKGTVEKRKCKDHGGEEDTTSQKGAYGKAYGFLGRERLVSVSENPDYALQ